MKLGLVRPLVLVAALLASAVGAVALTVEVASAKASYDSLYGYDRTWNAALRMVRVDMGFKVTEKDEVGGYLMFDYRSSEGGNRASPGSIEVVRGKDPDVPVRVIIQLAQMPQYHEQALAEALQVKMRQDYGDPPQRRAPPPNPPAQQPDPDAGAGDAGPAEK